MKMQQSDIDGIVRSGAIAQERGVSYFDNPHFADQTGRLTSSAAWDLGWRQADKGRDKSLQVLDRVKFW